MHLLQQLLLQLEQLFFFLVFLRKNNNVFIITIDNNNTIIMVDMLFITNEIISIAPNYFLFGFAIKIITDIIITKEATVQKPNCK